MVETPDTDPVGFSVGGAPVYLRKPTDGQMYVLYGVGAVVDAGGVVEDVADAMRLMHHAEDVLRYLAVPPAETDDEDAVSLAEIGRRLRAGTLELEDYFGLVLGVIERWGDKDQVEANRTDRRAAARRPAAKKTAVARPGRTQR